MNEKVTYRHWVIVVLAIVFTFMAGDWVHAATTSACYNIQDSDARAMCLARAHREPGQCYSVQRADLRAQCLAEVTR